MVEVLDGRSKEARAARAAAAAMAAGEGEDVTYLPGEGDPAIQKWLGFEFKANVPVRVNRADMIEAARNNRYFRVGSDERDELVVGRPKTAMEYRAFVVHWMKAIETIDQLAARWAEERSLREACEVVSDDLAWLGTIVEPKLHQMRKSEGLNEKAVADIWIRHGILELPWRA